MCSKYEKMLPEEFLNFLRTEIKYLIAELTRLEQDCSGYQELRESSIRKYLELMANIEKETAELASLKNTLATLTKEIETAENTLATLTKEIKNQQKTTDPSAPINKQATKANTSTGDEHHTCRNIQKNPETPQH